MTKIDYATHESIISGNRHDLQRTLLAFSLGAAPHLNRRALSAAVLSWRALKIRASTAIVIHVGGYDADPRELWEIPEVCDFVRRFCEKTDAHKHPAVEPQSRNLLLLCGADPDFQPRLAQISRQESLARSQTFFKQRIGGKDEADH
ncbi:hypothetical protein [Bradyrhizobium elkanii]|uniref:hypothetical protein n=1 Tax=Bradyrhizobium elkanii TaxID=29448 RepID=UPI0004B6E397|nr:hypothetical protein [Bradyrhizobium elkanii]WLA79624.1 hypothetical protein QNJ99_30035 [Bradyrhizobium elkanii]